REPESLSRDRLLDLKVLHALGNRRWPDHLVPKLVTQVGIAHVERYPAFDILDLRLGEHVANGIAHPQIGGYGAIVAPLTRSFCKYGENVCSCSDNIHAEDCNVSLSGDRLHDLSHCVGGGHDPGTYPIGKLAVAGRLLHDVFQKQLVDSLAGGQEIL